MKRKKHGCVLVLLLLTGLLLGCGKGKNAEEKNWQVLSAVPVAEGMEIKIAGENLLRNKKVKLEADSIEDEKYSVKALTDGITEDESLRWSSENDWENSEHWLKIEFPQKTTVSAVKLFWERLNVCDYALEISENGKDWEEVFVSRENPKDREQTIVLDKQVTTTFLRLHVRKVNQLEEDFSIYYQNVSLLEIQAFGSFTDEFIISSSCVKEGKDRMLEIPEVPKNYELRFLGADHEALIAPDGKVADTISETFTKVGFSLSKGGETVELPGMDIIIPASEGEEDDGKETLWDRKKIKEIYEMEPMEWLSLGGELQVDDTTVVAYDLLEEEVQILGEEGFQLTIDQRENRILIEGKTEAALKWGQVTLEKMLERNEGKLPAGKMRDYPSYQVRGFGIDVGRSPVTMEFLYKVVERMSEEKMNTLLVHLNDNQIITQSDYDGTLEGARQLYAGFRLESDVKNPEGVGITSTDLFYTKEEFARFVEEAKQYGVRVVPEIDTPGHSLSLVKVFPHLGIKNPETADLLDISRKEARELVKSIWKEYLVGENGTTAVFDQCDTIHIGMDEYFGEAKEYLAFLEELSDYVKEIAPEKTIRMWGSLTGMACDYSRISREIQIQLWSTDWADPLEMYEAGFDMINSQNTCLYLVPGTGYDWLDEEYLEREWEPNIFKSQKEIWEIPSYSSQMLGACYMLWNDMAIKEEMRLSEEELFLRFEKPIQIISDKLWR